jgi:hypothetical protein
MADEYYYSQQDLHKVENAKPSKAWYLLPVFLGLIGGLLGYFLLKNKDGKMAKRILIVGIIVSVIIAIVIFSGVLSYYSIFSPSAFMPSAEANQSSKVNAGPFEITDLSITGSGTIGFNVFVNQTTRNSLQGPRSIGSISLDLGATLPSCATRDLAVSMDVQTRVSCTFSAWIGKNPGQDYMAMMTIGYVGNDYSGHEAIVYLRGKYV